MRIVPTQQKLSYFSFFIQFDSRVDSVAIVGIEDFPNVFAGAKYDRNFMLGQLNVVSINLILGLKYDPSVYGDNSEQEAK